MVEDADYEQLMAKKAAMPRTKFGDAFDPAHVERINQLTNVNLE
jgi:hypothetical protein